MKMISKAAFVAALGFCLVGTASADQAASDRADKVVALIGMKLHAPNLKPLEGNWVLQRRSAFSPLSIMNISTDTNKLIRVWSFDYDNLDRRLGHDVPSFFIFPNALELGFDSSVKMFSISEDLQFLECSNCARPETWKRSDPNKDLSDRDYAKKMAGNPK